MLRDIDYAEELNEPGVIRWGRAEGRIERLRIKESDQIEIRFSWWKDAKLIPRPLDLSEEDLLALTQDAIAKGVFSPEFLAGLRRL
jgi:hypothetical protein